MPDPAWQDAFKSQSLRIGFQVALSRPMIEFLSAVADGVQWNRFFLGSSQAFPDNFVGTARSLEKRGLIERKPEEEIEANKHRRAETRLDLCSWTHYQLTPPGEAVVTLLKLAGLFLEQDAATERNARRGRGSHA